MIGTRIGMHRIYLQSNAVEVGLNLSLLVFHAGAAAFAHGCRVS